MYNAQIGYWLTLDPLLQIHSPYTFCANNPVRYVGPNGMWSMWNGGYGTNNPFEIADFLSVAKTNFKSNLNRNNAFFYVKNFYRLDQYPKRIMKNIHMMKTIFYIQLRYQGR